MVISQAAFSPLQARLYQAKDGLGMYESLDQ